MTATDTRPAGPAADSAAPKKTSVLRSGALMAAGSIVSRATGFIRSAVVVAALGTGLLGDGYAVANTVPNIIYILLVGGALNAVFVPELVRAAKEHADGGAAYTDRLLTACTAALVALTAAAVLAAPLIVSAYTGYTGAQASTTVALARYCLPQILFYGLFTLLGQVLNSRGRFGAMMWTPVLNNFVIIAVFGLFLYVSHDAAGGLTEAETRLLGLGTTAGIVVQALALIPSLRAARFRWRPRFDWRGSGLGRPLRNAGWTVMLVLTNQIAYWVVTRLSTATGQSAVEAGLAGGAGYTAYSNAYQLWIVPQGIITVSLVTALMPRMSSAATDGDLGAVRRDVSYALRSSAALVVPAAALMAALAPWVMGSVFGYGRTGAADIAVMAGMLTAFAPGLVAFSAQYVLSRGFYALSDTRTPSSSTSSSSPSTPDCRSPPTCCCPRAGRSPAWPPPPPPPSSRAPPPPATPSPAGSARARAAAANGAPPPYAPTCASSRPARPRPPRPTPPPAQPSGSATSPRSAREPRPSPWSSSSLPGPCAWWR